MYTPVPGVELMRSLRLIPDPWQIDVLESPWQRIILNCSRQAGKSTTVAVLALAEAMFTNDALVLILSRSHRQSRELFDMVRRMHRKLGAPLEQRWTTNELTLENGSRIVCLPCKEETIRGYSGVTLLIIDEAARVPEDIYQAVRPCSPRRMAAWSACPRPMASAASSGRCGRRAATTGTASRCPPA